MTRTHLVQFDAEYLSGPYAGMVIPGQTLTCPSKAQAEKEARFLAGIFESGDFTRAHTGHKYRPLNVAVYSFSEECADTRSKYDAF